MNKIFNKIKENPFYLYLSFYAIFLVILAIFRHASADEAYYLKETILISELLSKGLWLGDYGVGLHGFLFKLPVAISFLIIGRPSVFLATLFTISLNILSLLLFYKILRSYFFNKKYATWSIILLSVVFHFLQTSLSFNRDIPAVFTVFLFLYLYLRNANSWLIGVSLLLILDAKEHVFLTVAPLFGILLLIRFFYSIPKNGIRNSISEFLRKLFSGYILSVVWLVLMFTTSVIPINMFIASIVGVTQVGMDWNRSQFMTKVASQNLMKESGKEIVQISVEPYCDESQEIVENESDTNSQCKFLCTLIKLLNEVFSYVGKVLYPRTFSFISISKIIILPAIIHSVLMFLRWWRRKDNKLILPMILLFNILVVILRASHGRYLLCIAPIAVIFFVLFIKEGLKNQKYFRNVLFATTIFTLSGLLFESTFLIQKIIMDVGLLILLWSIWLSRKNNTKFLKLLKNIFLFALSICMLFTHMVFSYKIGQISNYLKYGYNMETKEISDQFSIEEKIWINNYGPDDLINVYRKNLFNEPEWTWELSDWVPKKKLLKTYSQNNTFSFAITDMQSFKEEIYKYKIEKVILVDSTLSEEIFPEEENFSDFFLQNWLKLDEEVKLKNKLIYIFIVE